MGRSRDIATILSKTEVDNTSNLVLLNETSSAGVDSAQVQNIGLQHFSTLDSLPITNLEAGQQAYVSGTNRLYMSNGSGWFNVALINASPSLTIDPAGAISLATDGTPTTITLIAADSDAPDALISFSVESDGSFSGLGSLSQDSSVFTITPLTESDASTTSATLTFKASDGINFASGSSTLNLAFAPGAVTGSYQTTRLINSNYSTNPFQISPPGSLQFTDASTNNNSLAYGNGKPELVSETPFKPGGHSVYTGSTNGGLVIDASSDFDFGTGDFTIEWWQYWAQRPSGGDTFYSSNYTTGLLIESQADTRAYNVYAQGSSMFSESTEADQNTWYHYALVRNGNTLTLYRNGTASAAVANTGSFGDATGPLYLFGGDGTNGNYFQYSFFHNLRIVKGSAVYTNSFSAPTEPVERITGTSLLTLQGTHIYDTNHRVKISGGLKQAGHLPFDQAEYDDTIHGTGSVQFGPHTGITDTSKFDGENNWLYTNSYGTAPGTGDFTVETWVQMNDHDTVSQGPTWEALWQISDATNGVKGTPADNMAVWRRPGTNQWAMYAGGGQVNSTASTHGTPGDRHWNHVAMVRYNSVTKLYVNGYEVMSTADTLNYTGTNFAWGCAYSANSYTFSGTMSDFRIMNSAVYTSAFTPPSEPLTTGSAQFHFQGKAPFRDKMQKNPMYVSHDPQIYNNQNTISKWGTGTYGSIYVSGTGTSNSGVLKLLPSPDNNFGTDDFTIEWWQYWAASPPSYGTFYSNNYGSNPNITIQTASTVRRYFAYANGTTIAPYESSAANLNQWYHYAVVRHGGYLKIYRDGIETASASIGSTIVCGQDAHASLFAAANGTYVIGQSYFEDIRITKGLARYTSTFTPPSAAFEG